MTDEEFNKKAKEIYDDACSRLENLLADAGVWVFESNYGLHRFLKHGDGSQKLYSGSELFRELLEKGVWNEKPEFTLMTDEGIRREFEQLRKDEIEENRRGIEHAKKALLDYESRMMELDGLTLDEFIERYECGEESCYDESVPSAIP